MSYIFGITVTIVIATIVGLIWVRGIDYMNKNHPDYKGEDFLNWDNKNPNWDKRKDPNDDWDNHVHTEGGF